MPLLQRENIPFFLFVLAALPLQYYLRVTYSPDHQAGQQIVKYLTSWRKWYSDFERWRADLDEWLDEVLPPSDWSDYDDYEDEYEEEEGRRVMQFQLEFGEGMKMSNVSDGSFASSTKPRRKRHPDVR